jgi:glycosyltransferase involved in cell wall biosynthesis
MRPLVTVVCLCYNHAPFIEEALRSIARQTYHPIQILIVDDGSTDHSKSVIKSFIEEFPQVDFLPLLTNLGNCAAFNAVWPEVKGDFIIDFATDDVMTPDRIEKQVNEFSKLGHEYGVVFTDATYIDQNGMKLRDHYDYLFKKKLIDKIPSGDVYRDVLSTYFIASPTMMSRKEVFEMLNGYDENLVYEDFDFWVRSARNYKYAFLNEKLTFIRKLEKSMSSGWYVRGDRQLHSTYLVCKKALGLNRDEEDRSALLKRIRYELRQAVFSQNHEEAQSFFSLLETMKAVGTGDKFLKKLNAIKLPLAPLRKLFHRIRY